jgi:hypothetical protein
MRQSGYFFSPEPLPGFKAGVCPAAGFGFIALGLLGSRLLLYIRSDNVPKSATNAWTGDHEVRSSIYTYIPAIPRYAYGS